MNMPRIVRFVRQAKGVPIHGLTIEALRDKEDWLKDARLVLRDFMLALGIKARITTNYAGNGVSGDVSLHGDHLFVRFSQISLAENTGFMYRSCQGQSDHVGGVNRWMRWDDLLQPDLVLENFRRVIEQAKELAPVKG